jgi:protein-tyrosine phosphatase
MVEFSDLIIFNNTEDIFDRMPAAGITPVVTHPERNPLLQQRLDRLERWTQSGIHLQVTAQSFFGRFGNSARRVAEELMERNLVHFVASDAPDTAPRPPRVNEAHDYVARKYGEQRAELLFTVHPGAALTGALLPAREPVARKKWYQLWR